jgi:ribosome-associated translation inhibitor RaiA
MLRRLLFAGFLVIFIWLGLLSNPAASQQIESRLNNLQADFNRVQSRLNQLESQLNKNPVPSSARTSITVPSGSRRNLSQQQREQMFDRLATLVVELKQQVNKLEQRVSQIESR